MAADDELASAVSSGPMDEDECMKDSVDGPAATDGLTSPVGPALPSIAEPTRTNGTGSPEGETPDCLAAVKSRAYQVEMLAESLKQNTIVTVSCRCCNELLGRS